METMPEQSGESEAPRRFFWWDVRPVARDNVRQDVSPYIQVVLYDPTTGSTDANILLTVDQALHAIEQLSRRLGQHLQRADLRRALATTDPAALNEALGAVRKSFSGSEQAAS